MELVHWPSMGGLLHLVQRRGDEEGTGRGIAVPNVAAHTSTASVPITVLLYDGPLLGGFNVAIKGLKNLDAFGVGSLSYLADCSEVSEIAMSEPRPPPSYADSFNCNGGGCLAFICPSGSTPGVLTPRCSEISGTAGGDLKTSKPWSEYPEYLPAVPSSVSASSTFCSPAQSARGAKRRVMSSSTLSSDIPSDIISLIRCSPTEIPVFGSAVDGRPTSSSTQFDRLGPGSISHLSARNGLSESSAIQWRPTTTVDDLDNPLATIIAMYNLEEPGSTDLDALDTNHVVLRQNDNFVECRYEQPALGEFSVEIPSSEQDLDEQLEQFLRVSADIEDTDLGRQCGLPPHGVAVSAANAVEATTYDPLSVSATSLVAVTEDSGDVPLVCLWTDCGQLFCTQDQLVAHIEQHVDQRCEVSLPRGCVTGSTVAVSDDYVCYWTGCSRQRRSFNARYKLLIHMRVHSGEKPHKCTVPTSYYTTAATTTSRPNCAVAKRPRDASYLSVVSFNSTKRRT